MYFYEGHVPHIIKLELLHILGSIILFITKTLKKNSKCISTKKATLNFKTNSKNIAYFVFN